MFNTEVWTVNTGSIAFRHDVVFDMHTEGWLYGLKEPVLSRALNRRQWLKTHDKPILMPKALPDYPTSITYPLKLIVEATKSDYFNNSIAYMLAMAYVCGVKQVMLFGCDFTAERADGTMMVEQGRACGEYWCGRLIESGAQVYTTVKSSLLDSDRRSTGFLYGFDEKMVTQVNEKGERKFIAPDYSAPRPQADLKIDGDNLGSTRSEVVKLPFPVSIVRPKEREVDNANQ